MIDLDELKRKARARAVDDEWDESSLRREWGEHIAPPDVVLALIERIRDAEGHLAKMCDLHMDEKRRRMAAEGEMKDLERAVASYQQAERERLR